MSLEQNIHYIKEEFNKDEKLLASMIRFEKWIKRYKIYLIILAVFILGSIIIYTANEYYQEYQQQQISKLYDKSLLGDEESIQKLKQSQSKLYDLYLLKQAITNNNENSLDYLQSSSKDPFIAKLAKYQNASLKRDIRTLALKDSTELGYLEAAFLDIQKGNLQEARDILIKIQTTIPTKK